MPFFRKTIFKVLCFLILFLLLDGCLKFVLEPASSFGHYAKIDLNNHKGKIDTVFMGSSWTYTGYNPVLYDEIMENSVSFNAGSTGQSPIDTYYYLKEILEDNPVKVVYYNIAPTKLQEAKNRYSSTVVNDRLTGINRIKHFFSAANLNLSKYYLASFRYRDKFDLHLICKNIIQKSNSKYFSGTLRVSEAFQTYSSRGYINYEASMLPGNNINYDVVGINWKSNNIQYQNLEYLNKIITLCKSKDIFLVLITPPFTAGYLQTEQNYDLYLEYIRTIAAEEDLSFIDFNCLKNSPFQDNLFGDYAHLNSEGAAVLTKLLCKQLYGKGEISQPEFYHTLRERTDLQERVGGVRLQAKESGNHIFLSAKASGPKNSLLEYRYFVYDTNAEDWEPISDYIIRPYFVYKLSDQENTCKFRVECRIKNDICNALTYCESKAENTRDFLLSGKYDTKDAILTLYASEREGVHYRFSRWNSDGSFSVIQDVSGLNMCKISLPPQGMYRFKVEFMDSNNKKILYEKQLFIDMTNEKD